MKRLLARFLQAVIVLTGIVALALLLWEPHIEGRNQHATFTQIYLQDPFLAYAYVASIPFFLALCHAFRMFGYVGHGAKFLQVAVRSLRAVKYCAVAIIGFVIGGEVWILSVESDDHAGGVVVGLAIIVASIMVAVAARILARRVHRL